MALAPKKVPWKNHSCRYRRPVVSRESFLDSKYYVLFFFDAHAVLFTLSLLSTSFIKGLYYKISYPHVCDQHEYSRLHLNSYWWFKMLGHYPFKIMTQNPDLTKLYRIISSRKLEKLETVINREKFLRLCLKFKVSKLPYASHKFFVLLVRFISGL